MRTILLFSAIVIMSFPIYSQIAGCMDKNAINYNANATYNDGSCTYPVTNYTPTLLTNLSDTVRETSGLTNINNHIWTFNDGGNTNQIFEINTANGKIARTITIKNAINNDWESMTQSSTHLFIGDFGNNYGNRKDLCILKISKTELQQTTDNTVNAEFIYFSYPDQTDFPINPKINNNNFDGEAMFYANDSLHIFSKNWLDLKTKHYRLPSSPGTYSAYLQETYNVNLLVTDADYCPQTKNIVLLGYKDGGIGILNSYCYLLFDYHGTNFFSGNKRKLGLGSTLTIGQTEGIFIKENNSGMFSSERIENAYIVVPQRIYLYDFRPYFYYNTTSIETNRAIQGIDKIYPNPFGDYVMVEIDRDFDECFYTISNSYGVLMQKGTLKGGKNRIELTALPPGVYIFNLNEKNINYKLIKR